MDALRGFAALIICVYHFLPSVTASPVAMQALETVDLGKYGVMLFFLVSGYVIPMSLERHGSLRSFWIGRLFRIYPAYLMSCVGLTAILFLGLADAGPQFGMHVAAEVFAHASMTPELVGLPSGLIVYWTLGFEMAFYLIVSALFVLNLHHRSALWAVGLATSGLLMCGLPQLSGWSLSTAARLVLAASVTLGIFVAIANYVRRRRPIRQGTAIAVLVVAAALLFLHGNVWAGVEARASWEAFTYLAVMFSGTVLFRMENGGIGGAKAAVTLVFVALSTMISQVVFYGNADPAGGAARSTVARSLVTDAAIVITFAVFHSLRRRQFPAPATWLGRVSYSLYLLHLFVVAGVRRAVPDLAEATIPARALVFLGYLTACLAVAWLGYRLIEMPGQEMGRRLTRRQSPEIPDGRSHPRRTATTPSRPSARTQTTRS